MSTPIYLDYAATTPLDPQVLAAMQPWLAEGYGNPSSLHSIGRQAKQAVETARQQLAQCLHCQPNELVFTAGGSESDNLALIGVANALKHQTLHRHIITTSIEHPAVANACNALATNGWDMTYLPVTEEGFVQEADLRKALRPETVLVSIIHGHNEIGTLQAIDKLSAAVKAHQPQTLFHTDAVQTVGKLPIALSAWPGVDYLSFAAHKFYGPKGVGGLFIRQGAPEPAPLIYGGGQENNRRSGTENVAGIVGMATALSRACDTMANEARRLTALQTTFIEHIQANFNGNPVQAVLNGPVDPAFRVPGTIHFSFVGPQETPIEGETLVLKLDLHGICVSSGSACHSAVIEPSRTIQALGKSDALARSTVRFSLGKYTTPEQITQTLGALETMLNRLKIPNPV